jgi:hypothetical protein
LFEIAGIESEMKEYTKSTNREHSETLPSRIVTAVWARKLCAAGGPLNFEVWTEFVGDGAAATLKVKDQKGRAVETVKGKVFGNRFVGSIAVPEKGVQGLSFTVELSKHGLKAASNACQVLPPIHISSQKWSQEEAHQGDVVKLTADVENLPDGSEVMIRIY